ncbi:SNF2-related domain-containing protein [Heterostelium album PN500]|uniref:SNF2-related domain-containing protein n=1 Tax=Heterostelium pallidum (strain ATCC 26659 / Pp 5 / PN500) TaxID=670386 RepID=D3BCP1_HETP5|nr:SNF2-related domain-containing protein [Heterostelium album PN500]EFA80683.1 SNF2-related domain-containing protein [Heterostelium album PN500]|eukprot:XP_020432803.1 SNF2-related domain-containing protein [Heterostelium album PN500]
MSQQQQQHLRNSGNGNNNNSNNNNNTQTSLNSQIEDQLFSYIAKNAKSSSSGGAGQTHSSLTHPKSYNTHNNSHNSNRSIHTDNIIKIDKPTNRGTTTTATSPLSPSSQISPMKTIGSLLQNHEFNKTKSNSNNSNINNNNNINSSNNNHSQSTIKPVLTIPVADSKELIKSSILVPNQNTLLTQQQKQQQQQQQQLLQQQQQQQSSSKTHAGVPAFSTLVPIAKKTTDLSNVNSTSAPSTSSSSLLVIEQMKEKEDQQSKLSQKPKQTKPITFKSQILVPKHQPQQQPQPQQQQQASPKQQPKEPSIVQHSQDEQPQSHQPLSPKQQQQPQQPLSPKQQQQQQKQLQTEQQQSNEVKDQRLHNFLASLKLLQYESILEEESIGWDQLLKADVSELKLIGFKLGHIIDIKDALKQYKGEQFLDSTNGSNMLESMVHEKVNTLIHDFIVKSPISIKSHSPSPSLLSSPSIPTTTHLPFVPVKSESFTTITTPTSTLTATTPSPSSTSSNTSMAPSTAIAINPTTTTTTTATASTNINTPKKHIDLDLDYVDNSNKKQQQQQQPPSKSEPMIIDLDSDNDDIEPSPIPIPLKSEDLVSETSNMVTETEQKSENQVTVSEDRSSLPDFGSDIMEMEVDTPNVFEDIAINVEKEKEITKDTDVGKERDAETQKEKEKEKNVYMIEDKVVQIHKDIEKVEEVVKGIEMTKDEELAKEKDEKAKEEKEKEKEIEIENEKEKDTKEKEKITEKAKENDVEKTKEKEIVVEVVKDIEMTKDLDKEKEKKADKDIIIQQKPSEKKKDTSIDIVDSESEKEKEKEKERVKATSKKTKRKVKSDRMDSSETEEDELEESDDDDDENMMADEEYRKKIDGMRGGPSIASQLQAGSGILTGSGSSGGGISTGSFASTIGSKLSNLEIDLDSLDEFVLEKKNEWLTKNVNHLKSIAKWFWEKYRNQLDQQSQIYQKLNSVRFNSLSHILKGGSFKKSDFRLVEHQFEECWKQEWLLEILKSKEPPNFEFIVDDKDEQEEKAKRESKTKIQKQSEEDYMDVDSDAEAVLGSQQPTTSTTTTSISSSTSKSTPKSSFLDESDDSLSENEDWDHDKSQSNAPITKSPILKPDDLDISSWNLWQPSASKKRKESATTTTTTTTTTTASPKLTSRVSVGIPTTSSTTTTSSEDEDDVEFQINKKHKANDIESASSQANIHNVSPKIEDKLLVSSSSSESEDSSSDSEAISDSSSSASSSDSRSSSDSDDDDDTSRSSETEYESDSDGESGSDEEEESDSSEVNKIKRPSSPRLRAKMSAKSKPKSPQTKRQTKRIEIMQNTDINNVNSATLKIRQREEEVSNKIQALREQRGKSIDRNSLVIFPGTTPEHDILINSDIGVFLKPYQMDGVRFLWDNIVVKEKGCILAHSMGLGKSIQTVSFIFTHHTHFPNTKYLLIVPANTLYNWMNEFHKWLPKDSGFRKHLYFDNTSANISRVVSTWWCNDSHLSDNSLKEYYTMIDYIRPLHLGTVKEFQDRFIKPIEYGNRADADKKAFELMRGRLYALQNLISDFVQRLGPEVLAKDLPNKVETIISLKGTQIQYNLLQTLRRLKKKIIEEQEICTLICNHPDTLLEKKPINVEKVNKMAISDMKKLLDENFLPWRDCLEKQDLVNRIIEMNERIVLAENSMFPLELEKYHYRKGIVENSTKMSVFFFMLEEFERLKERTVAFSSSLVTLNLMEYFLQKKGWKPGRDYYRLDGAVRPQERQNLINKFNDTGNQCKLFIISTKAGSLGTNLTAGTRVILMDLLWNPVHERQAVYRCFRIGQTKPVYVYTLIIAGSLEENIYNRLVFKQSLAKRAIDQETPIRHQIKDQLDGSVVPDQDTASIKECIESTPDVVLKKLLTERPNSVIKVIDYVKMFEHDAIGNLTPEEGDAAISSFKREIEQQSAQFQQQQHFNLNTSKRFINFTPPLTKTTPL